MVPIKVFRTLNTKYMKTYYIKKGIN